jgi:GMP synthase-like glutamine amidotransferase
MTTIYSALYPAYAHLEQLPDVTKCGVVYLPEHLQEEDSILILHGGSDISPKLYNEKPNKFTWAEEDLSTRDQKEVNLVSRAIAMKIPIFGICRGAQFLCAHAGGKLYQHVTGHQGGKHKITTNKGAVFVTTSAHHQMMNPAGTEHQMIAWSTNCLSREYLGEEEYNHTPPEVEPEIVFFPGIKGLAVQGHPEWMSKKSSFVEYVLYLISRKLM